MADNVERLRQRFEAGDALPLRIAIYTELSGFPVEPNRCHVNVATWVAAHSNHNHVRGWLVTESFGGCIFDKHSVVGFGDELLDITPRRDQFVRRFLIYEGTPEEFDLPPHQLIG